MRNELGNFAPSCIRYWTEQAIRCFKCNLECKKCGLKIESQHCQMKAAVLELVKKFGKPKKEVVKGSFVKNGKRYYFDGEGKDNNCLSASGQDNG